MGGIFKAVGVETFSYEIRVLTGFKTFSMCRLELYCWKARIFFLDSVTTDTTNIRKSLGFY